VPELPPVLRPLAEHPDAAALFLDFDGTIAPIVSDPASARPLAGAPTVLDRLAAVLDLVAVVSGRPGAVRGQALGVRPGLRIVGLYGLEWLDEAGGVCRAPEAERWRDVVARVSDEARRDAPAGVTVEDKGLTATLHWRGHPEGEPWARAFVTAAVAGTGLVAQPGRMALELRPPLAMDKGAVVEQMGSGHATR
jgi:trehalose 6-phosphate phosphatase